MKAYLLLAAMAATPVVSQGALVLTSATPVVETFDAFAGTVLTVPVNFTPGGTSAYNGYITTGTGTYNGANGWYALRDDSNLADRAFGSRAPAGSTYTLTCQVTNNTGYSLSGLSIGYRTEQYTGSDPAAGSSINLTGSTDGTTFNTTNLTGDLSKTALAGSPDTVFADPIVTQRLATYTGSIANGGSVHFRFTWVPTGGGTRVIWGVDDFSVTAVPEPAALGIFALAAPLALRRRRGL